MLRAAAHVDALCCSLRAPAGELPRAYQYMMGRLGPRYEPRPAGAHAHILRGHTSGMNVYQSIESGCISRFHSPLCFSAPGARRKEPRKKGRRQPSLSYVCRFWGACGGFYTFLVSLSHDYFLGHPLQEPLIVPLSGMVSSSSAITRSLHSPSRGEAER